MLRTFLKETDLFQTDKKDKGQAWYKETGSLLSDFYLNMFPEHVGFHDIKYNVMKLQQRDTER